MHETIKLTRDLNYQILIQNCTYQYKCEGLHLVFVINYVYIQWRHYLLPMLTEDKVYSQWKSRFLLYYHLETGKIINLVYILRIKNITSCGQTGLISIYLGIQCSVSVHCQLSAIRMWLRMRGIIISMIKTNWYLIGNESQTLNKLILWKFKEL